MAPGDDLVCWGFWSISLSSQARVLQLGRALSLRGLSWVARIRYTLPSGWLLLPYAVVIISKADSLKEEDHAKQRIKNAHVIQNK